jgi:hypothetical protein
MKHSSIRQLFEYWNERRGLRSAPDRGEIEPSAIRRVLADTFILAFEARAGHPFRLAGTRVCAAFGRELKGEAFVDLWAAEGRDLVRELLAIVATESNGVVASAHAESAEGATLELELLLLPLSHRGRTDARVIGALVPVAAPYWLGTSTLGPLALDTHRFLDPSLATRPAPRIAPMLPTGRIRRGLMIYDGGQF